MNYIAVIVASIIMLCSCSGKAKEVGTGAPAVEKTVELGAFSADSAFAFALKQVEFGYRVPGTDAHARCAEWLAERLAAYGADDVSISNGSTTAWNGDKLPVKNIFAQFAPEKNARVLLVAHYDTRPWADYDPDPTKRDMPIDGANDGASGVAVLLEIARNIGMKAPEVGVDILLTDCEDYGAKADVNIANSEQTWCIGSRQFAENLPYKVENMPRYGILLDMVGNTGARFHQEYFSAEAASVPTAKVWGMAKKLGLQNRFPAMVGGAVTDDHLPLIISGIQTTDIIENRNRSTGSFPPTWHTHEDNMENLDAETLGIVGRVVLNVIYSEKI